RHDLLGSTVNGSYRTREDAHAAPLLPGGSELRLQRAGCVKTAVGSNLRSVLSCTATPQSHPRSKERRGGWWGVGRYLEAARNEARVRAGRFYRRADTNSDRTPTLISPQPTPA